MNFIRFFTQTNGEGNNNGNQHKQLVQAKFNIGNESVLVQLARCWFPGLAISNAKI